MASQLSLLAAIDFVTFYSESGERLGTIKAKEAWPIPDISRDALRRPHSVPEQGLRVLDIVTENEAPSLRGGAPVSLKDGGTQALLLTHVRLEPLLEHLRMLSEEWSGAACTAASTWWMSSGG